MISFREFLLSEGRIDFQKGKDQDYTSHPTQFIVFSEEDESNYIIQGKTHGALSHAVKHLHEFKYNDAKKIAEKARRIIVDYFTDHPEEFCKIYDVIRGWSNDSGVSIVKSATPLTILNALDVINDKLVHKKKLIEVEHKLVPCCRSIEDKYINVIQDKIAKETDLTGLDLTADEFLKQIKGAEVIKFEGESSIADSLHVWIDFRDRSMIIATPKDTIKSCYKIHNCTNKSTAISMFYNKKFKAKNPELNKALMSLI